MPFWRLAGLSLPRFLAPTEKMAFLSGYTSPCHVRLPCSQCCLLFGGPAGQGIVQTAMTHFFFFFPVSEFIPHDYFVPLWNSVIWIKGLKVTQWGVELSLAALLWVSCFCYDSTQRSGNDKVLLVENLGSWYRNKLISDSVSPRQSVFWRLDNTNLKRRAIHSGGRASLASPPQRPDSSKLTSVYTTTPTGKPQKQQRPQPRAGSWV